MVRECTLGAMGGTSESTQGGSTHAGGEGAGHVLGAELEFAREVLRHEAAALEGLASRLDERFCLAVEILCRCADAGGTVLVSGIGKSGHVGAKISATLASVGIPSHAVHPTEAAHGDLGRFRATDVCICLSYSGRTEEVVNLAASLRQDGLPIIAITGGGNGHSSAEPSDLERLATVTLHLGVVEEAGHLDAPTTSTTATLALGDALALAASRRRNFTPHDFAKRHPGGSLGMQLRPVTEILRFRVGERLKTVGEAMSVREALEAAAPAPGERRPGAMLVTGDGGRLTGIFTDADLRRLVRRDPGLLESEMRGVMTASPRTLPDTALVKDAVLMVRTHRQDEIPIIDGDGKPVGLLDVQDLVTLKLVAD